MESENGGHEPDSGRQRGAVGSPFQAVYACWRHIIAATILLVVLSLALARPAHAAEVDLSQLGEWVSNLVSVLFTGIGGLFLELTRRRSNAQASEMVEFRALLAKQQQAQQDSFEAHRKDREAGLSDLRRTMDDMRDRMVRRDELDAADRRHKERMAEMREEHRASQTLVAGRFNAMEQAIGQLSGRTDQLHNQVGEVHKTVADIHTQLGRLAEAWGAK